MITQKDLRLPTWGPYSKRYAGVSHIADTGRGIRFDLSVFPGLYRRKVDVPNVTWESGFHPWEAAADISYYSLRHELLWKDQVYCDISYSKLDDRATLVRCELVNNTDAPENLALHYMAYINFPTQKTHSHLYKPMETYAVDCPPDVINLHALDYEDMGYKTPRPTDNLMPDGLKRGELRYPGLVAGSGLGAPRSDPRLPNGFGMEAGDWALYSFTLEEDLADAIMQIRYAQWSDGVSFRVSGSADGMIDFLPFPEEEPPRFASISLGSLKAGRHEIMLTSNGGAPVLWDSVLVGSGENVSRCAYTLEDTCHTPELTLHEADHMLTLKYGALDRYYGIWWDFDMFWLREILNSELDTFMRSNVHHHTNHIMTGDGLGHFANVFMRPIPVEPHARKVLYGVVLDADSEEKTLLALKAHAAKRGSFPIIYDKAREKRARFGGEAGQPYQFSQERMAATTLTNLVFPVYRQREYIAHNTPGRWWDCLYTWDSGFIGIGMNTVDARRAEDCLKTYLTDEGDSHNAFIHHGSMVPTQFYQFGELWNETQSKELLAYCYPRMRQYYEFYVGRLGSSTMAKMKSGLLKTWDYFYNSGGWDDYPPQVRVHRDKLEDTTTPASNTAHAVRCARLLCAMAGELGVYTEDIPRYEKDIAGFMDALNRHAYDADSGYFSYVTHDYAGNPNGILFHENGQNFNMGLDGVEPMLTGHLSDAQLDRIVGLLMEPGRLWCDIGLSTVDQTADYYTIDGYWNGAVWMAHQWFIFKALLDSGHADEAWRIAHTALDVWKRETDTSFHCFEHFIVDSKRGAGWHQFSGLSTPVLYWFNAYYVPGRLTFGFDTWPRSRAFSDGNRRLRAHLMLTGAAHRSGVVIASMAEGERYMATFNGTPAQARRRTGGALEILLPNSAKEGVLEIFPIEA